MDRRNQQEQSSGGVLQIRFFKNCAEFRGKYLCWSLFLNGVSGIKTYNFITKWLQQRCFPVNFAKFWFKMSILWNICKQLLLNQLSVSLSFLFWIVSLEEEEENKLFEDNPWIFWQVICTCEGEYCKTNYKYEICQHTKTNACCRNISCSFICSFILWIFLLCGNFKIWLNVSHQTNLINKNKSYFLKIWSNKNLSKFALYTLWNLFDPTNLIKLIWTCSYSKCTNIIKSIFFK